MNDWNDESDRLLRLAYYIAQLDLMRHYKISMLDKAIRSASDILSCESTRVHNNTGSMLQWCLRWTEDAQRIYWENKKSTHRITTQGRDANGKRLWAVEHPHPLKNVKDLLLEGCSYDTFIEWMKEYGHAVIVSQAELAKLPQLGNNRYEQFDIRYSRFDPGHLTRTR